ncbi:N-acyl homoserine lactonase family protein [Arthrobacter sp. I2-34]|uniref:N-acyl homoserine lactonase family protein n=1 Tax=Arthrobacter hankyongi TaxID=2904801 RepID=A0ABS9L8L6_9MICC|nr:N-acyl homoserine lactonase family protein [Arthrobacter hankyongi]MCG2623025.1 N-acyl homoserine lactonase family protein [Arthrobacter hankyongi]
MSVKIQHIVTGELESSLPVSLLNAGAHPDLPVEERRPFGWRTDIRRRNGDITEGVMVPVPVWLIQGTDQVILVDTGLGDIDEVSEMQSRYGVDFVASRSDGQDLVQGLSRHGVTPEDVDTVILTHLHFDHVGNNELFPNATFIVQKDELPQAEEPPSFCMFYYPEYSYKIDAVRDRLQIVDGDHRINNSVRLVKIGGHTPGCMVVMVETDAGTVCLTSDVMYNYRNLELNWPMGSFWDLPELMNGYDRIRKEADIIIPEHDWKFRELYPTGEIG